MKAPSSTLNLPRLVHVRREELPEVGALHLLAIADGLERDHPDSSHTGFFVPALRARVRERLRPIWN